MISNLATKQISILLFFVILSLTVPAQETNTEADSLHISIMLSEAILANDTLTFDSLMATELHVNVAEHDGVTPLMYASQEGNLYFVGKLLEAGANVNQIPDNKVTALQSAVVANRFEAVQLLLENGADIGARNKWGDSPIISAAQNNNQELIQLLIDSGADINDADTYGNSILHYASSFGNNSLITYLIENGADPHAKDNQGYTPLMVATFLNLDSTAEIFVSYGVNLNVVNNVGYSALTIAILNGNSYLAELFLLNGADGNILKRKAKDHWYLSKGTGKYMRKVLRRSDVKRNILPVFTDWAGGMKFGTADKHFTTAISFGVHEKKYNLWIGADFGLTPFAFSTLEEINQKHYQFWEHNYWVAIEVDKYFSLLKKNENVFGIFAGATADYTFGSYRATSLKPQSTFHVLPTIGGYWNYEITEIRLAYKRDFFQNDNNAGAVEVQLLFYIGGN